uniref:PK-1 n=1 Tax=Iragoides fasciata nucleopolyhedrovirus TaxID=571205 RepID=B6VC32_9ABAC|nr:PK-1 [Iragoides fasciata nucleopolyhedrovirus]
MMEINNTIKTLTNFYNTCKIVKPRHKIVDGKFGKITVLFHKPTSKLYLEKIIDSQNFNLNELKVHNLMKNHKNFIKMYFSYNSLNNHVIVMDYINCPDLFGIVQQKGKLPSKQVSCIIFQLCSALNDLHELGFIHNDVKLENVLYFEAIDTVFVCDYGLCRRENSTSIYDGTLDYFCPEKIQNQNYTRSFDWYAVGILTYKLLTGGKHPFENSTDKESKIFKIEDIEQRQKYVDINMLNEIKNDDAQNFVYNLIKYDLKYRTIKFRQIVKHRFLIQK